MRPGSYIKWGVGGEVENRVYWDIEYPGKVRLNLDGKG